ncbi:MAG: GspJ family type II secretion system protein [Candidatus Omnitrophica bacterium]|nr:GspJ family type II secretion system protein [Candidatus Omnitrophota bacterium]
MCFIKKKNKKGFTLIEILIVSGLVVVISLAIYATLSNGLRLWQRLNQAKEEEEVLIFFEKFLLDLRNAFKFKGIDFVGKNDLLEFATLVKSPSLKKTTVGKVIYYYDKDEERLVRKRLNFSQLYYEEDLWQESLNYVKKFKLQYYFYDKDKKEYFWLEDWPIKENLPLAIRIAFDFDNGKQILRFIRTVNVPVSG